VDGLRLPRRNGAVVSVVGVRLRMVVVMLLLLLRMGICPVVCDSGVFYDCFYRRRSLRRGWGGLYCGIWVLFPWLSWSCLVYGCHNFQTHDVGVAQTSPQKSWQTGPATILELESTEPQSTSRLLPVKRLATITIGPGTSPPHLVAAISRLASFFRVFETQPDRVVSVQGKMRRFMPANTLTAVARTAACDVRRCIFYLCTCLGFRSRLTTLYGTTGRDGSGEMLLLQFYTPSNAM
jgi:hypothetical protein